MTPDTPLPSPAQTRISRRRRRCAVTSPLRIGARPPDIAGRQAAPGPASAEGPPGTGRDWLPRLVTAALVAAVTAMLAAPAIWSASVLDVKYAGTSYDAGAGPAGLNQGPVCVPSSSPAGNPALCGDAQKSPDASHPGQHDSR